jgi:methyl-accepting chemotaxis protein
MLDSWRRRLEGLPYYGKMVTLSIVVAVAFVLVLLVNMAFGLLNERRLGQIEGAYYPSVEASRTLQETLASVQRGLQDAAGAADLERLRDADSLRSAFLAVIDAAVEGRAIDTARAGQMQTAFVLYYALARRMTEQLIAGAGGDSLATGLRLMRQRHHVIVTLLKTNTAADQQRIRAAFADARSQQRIGWTLTGVIVLATLTAVLGLSRFITLSVAEPLREAVDLADALALGEMQVDITVRSADEVGRLMQSLQRMTTYLRDMSIAAEAIAQGDTAVRVIPRSPRDVFGNAFARMISALEERAQVATAIAEGDLSVRLTPSSPADVFGHAFVAMTRRITEVIGGTLGNAEAVAASALQLSEASRRLAESATDQTASLVTTHGSLDAVGVAFAKNTESGRLVEELALDGVARAEANGAAMQQTVVAMETILKRLALMDDIAAQSALLSINASIEAARAGEYGRGFEVVADEVGKLADESQSSAKKIGAVTAGTREAVARSQVLLDALVESIRETARQAQLVAVVSAQQDAALTEVNRELAQVDGLARRNAAAADELADLAGGLAGQAESLARIVGYFRVPSARLSSTAARP